MQKSLLWFVSGIAITIAVMGTVWAATSGEAEIRVVARKLDSGSVEVAVQQRDGGVWGEAQRPLSRFLPAQAITGRWYRSSSVAVTTPQAEPQADAHYCLVTHGRPGDEAFWVDQFEGLAYRWDVYHGGISVSVKHAATPDAQAAMIRECVDEGAVAIGSSLAAPSGVRAALQEARAAGIVIVSFNSGLEDFRQVGAARHVSINETAAGIHAGERFVEHGVAGTVVCVVHEQQNTGLEERCNGLEAGYTNGAVERLYVSGLGDAPATARQLTMRLQAENSQSPVAGIVTLNSEIGLLALEAIENPGLDVTLATFDQTAETLRAIEAGRILFAIDTMPQYQGWYALSSMLFLAKTEPRLRLIFGVDDPGLILGQIPILIGPRVFTAENAGEWLEFFKNIQAGGNQEELD